MKTDRNQGKGSAVFILPWLLPAFFSIYFKYFLMVRGGGFAIAAQSLGRKHGFAFWEKLSFFQIDIITAVLVSVMLLVLGRLLPFRLRVPFSVLLSLATTLALYAQLRAFRAVGQFISFQMFWTAFSWGWHEPAAYISYLGWKGLVSGLALAAFLPLGYLALSKRNFRCAEIVRGVRHQEGLATLEAVFVLCLFLVSVGGWLPRLPSAYQSSIVLESLSAYWHEQNVQTADLFHSAF